MSEGRLTGYYWVNGFKWSSYPEWKIVKWELESWWIDGDDYNDTSFIEIDEIPIEREPNISKQQNNCNKPNVSINEGSGLCVSVAVMNTLKYRLATIQSETDRLTRETMIELFLVDITEC